MTTQTKVRYTPGEYLALERKAQQKSEYFAGEVFAMSGASEQHNLIVTNLVGELRAQLKGRPCKTYPSDMRLKVVSTGLFTYPDVMVVCGQTLFDEEQQDTLLNPSIIIEVLSKSTEGHDRGEKFAHYRKVQSLTDYLLVSQSKYHVEHYVRQPDNHWLLSESDGLQNVVRIATINCDLSLAEVYDKVELPTA